MRVIHVVMSGLVVAGFSSIAHAQGAAAVSSRCEAKPAPQVEQQLTSGGRQRTYRLFVPPGDNATPLPVMLDLHGSGGTAAGQAKTSGLETLAAKERFIVATLQGGDGNRWNVPPSGERADDVAYVSDVIDHLAARACIDLTRVYATGFSGGARMSSLLACRLNRRIAAVAPVAGLRWPGPCEGRAVPILTFHGLADKQNPYAGGVEGRNGEWVESVPDALASWARHNGCKPDLVTEDPDGPLSTMRYDGCAGGAEVRLIRIDDLGHTWPRQELDATSVMWQFLRNHVLSPSTAGASTGSGQ